MYIINFVEVYGIIMAFGKTSGMEARCKIGSARKSTEFPLSGKGLQSGCFPGLRAPASLKPPRLVSILHQRMRYPGLRAPASLKRRRHRELIYISPSQSVAAIEPCHIDLRGQGPPGRTKPG